MERQAIAPDSCYAHAVQITVQLPDDLAQLPDPGREALVSLAVEGYRSGVLSHYQSGQLLGLSRFEFEGLLKQRSIREYAYDADDLEEDRKTLDSLQAKGLLRLYAVALHYEVGERQADAESGVS